jgi:NADH/NAD ratio-sensing transcriptional regulator Rex
MTETEIAQELEVDQSTVRRDIKVLKELSQQFVYDLAKSDLDDLLVWITIPGFLP